MRILIILREFYSPSKPIGGAERQALKLATSFIAKGLSVRIVSGKWDWGQPCQDQIHSIPVDRHFTAWGMFDIRGLRRISPYIYLLSLFIYLFRNRNDYDIIHCHSALYGAFVVASAGRLLGKKTVIRSMASGAWGDVQRVQQGTTIWGAKWMQRRAAEADCFVALNSQVEEELVDIGVSPKRIVNIPNGVEIDQKNPKKNYEIGDTCTGLFVGRLHPQKGVDVLLHAFNKAAQMMPELSWRLQVAGSGYLRDELEGFGEQLSINEMVDFLGEVDDLKTIYGGADIFILPSRSEGMSNALLEAMANGLPSIASNIPGNFDLIINEKNGILVEADNRDEFANSIVALAQDQGLREQIGNNAFAYVAENFSIDEIAHRYVSLYDKLMTQDMG